MQPYKCKINLICHEAWFSMMSQWKNTLRQIFYCCCLDLWWCIFFCSKIWWHLHCCSQSFPSSQFFPSLPRHVAPLASSVSFLCSHIEPRKRNNNFFTYRNSQYEISLTALFCASVEFFHSFRFLMYLQLDTTMGSVECSACQLSQHSQQIPLLYKTAFYHFWLLHSHTMNISLNTTN